MRLLRPLALLLFAALCLTGFKPKPKITIRFHAEANPRDSERFASPVALKNPPRAAYIAKTPVISERQILGFYAYPAADGTWGSVFKLDQSGRISLEVVSTQQRGTSLVAFFTTKTTNHQVVDMVIDKPVRDGIITIPSGLTALEVDALKRNFKPIYPKGEGPTPKPKKQKKGKPDPLPATNDGF